MTQARVQRWIPVVMAVCASLMVGLAGWALVATEPGRLGRVAYATVAIVNLVAAVVSGLVVREQVTGRGDVDEGIARFGTILCVLSGTVLPNAVTTVDEPDWRALFVGLGLLVAALGVAMAAVAPRAVRGRLGLDAGWPN